MFVKLGIKNAIRYKRISLFLGGFYLLLTVLLSSGLQLRNSLNEFLLQCDEQCVTIGEIEYLGKNFPDSSYYDDALLPKWKEIRALLESNTNFRDFVPNASLLGSIEGMKRVDKDACCKDNFVGDVVVYPYYVESTGNHTAKVKDDLYSREDCENHVILLDSNGLVLEPGRRYLIGGKVYVGEASQYYVQIGELSHRLAIANGAPEDIASMAVDITDMSEDEIEKERELFLQLADTFTTTHNSIKLIGTTGLENELPFHNNEAYIVEGRSFLKEEYVSRDSSEGASAEGSCKHCIISSELANMMKYSVGDVIAIDNAAACEYTFADSYWVGSGFAGTYKYEIVGIFDGDRTTNYTIYVAEDKTGLERYGTYSYSLARVVFDNENTSEEINRLNELLPNDCRLTVYDGGYQVMAQPIKQILTTVTLICILSFVTATMFLFLFGYLYVYRQKATITAMHYLGTRKRSIHLAFLSGTVFIALCASVIAVFAGFYGTKLAMKKIIGGLGDLTSSSLLFSNANLLVTDRIKFTDNTRITSFICVAAVILAVLMLLTVVFTAVCLEPKMKKSKGRKASGRAKTRKLSGSASQYASLSIIRNGARSLLPVLLTLASIILMCRLIGAQYSYEAQLTELDNSYACSGHFTNMRGSTVFDTSVTVSEYEAISACEYVSDVYASSEEKYTFIPGEPFGDYDKEYTRIPNPVTQGYQYATFCEHMLIGSSLVYTNDIACTEDYYKLSAPVITYMEGATEDDLYHETYFEDEVEFFNCLVSDRFLSENGLKYGDRIVIFYNAVKPHPLYLRIIGSYLPAGHKDNIFVGLEHILTGGYMRKTAHFNSLIFNLTNARYLDAIKDFFTKMHYSNPYNLSGRRIFVMIEDAEYYSVKNSLEQKIDYMEVLFPILCKLLEIVAFIASFAVTKARSREITTLLLLGVSKRRCFLCIYLEQFALSTTAFALGILICKYAGDVLTLNGLVQSFIFWAMWNLGTVIAVLRYLRKQVIYVQKDI